MKLPSSRSSPNRILLLFAILLAIAFGSSIVASAPYQELEPRKGHVPVYIRYGDTPLSEIHPKLAEAFREDESEKVPQIESAALILEDPIPPNDAPPTESNAAEAKTAKDAPNNEKISDIASFDVIKGEDKPSEN